MEDDMVIAIKDNTGMKVFECSCTWCEQVKAGTLDPCVGWGKCTTWPRGSKKSTSNYLKTPEFLKTK